MSLAQDTDQRAAGLKSLNFVVVNAKISELEVKMGGEFHESIKYSSWKCGIEMADEGTGSCAAAAREMIKRGAMYTVLGGLVTALATPLTVLGLTGLIDSKWAIAVDRFHHFHFQLPLWIHIHQE